MAAKKTPTKSAAGTRAKTAQAPAKVKRAVSAEQIDAIRAAMSKARFVTAPIATGVEQQTAQLQGALKLCYEAMDEVHAILQQIEGKGDGTGDGTSGGGDPAQ